jgi:WD40 repeat protein
MTGLPLARRGSRIILFGTGNHPPGSRLPPVPSIGPSLTDVAAAFRERAGVPGDNITLILDPANPSELGGALDAAARDATDVICMYFAGHGLVGDGGELYLATAATADPARGLEYTALPYRTLLRIIRDCAAPAAAIILDCCFAGRADAPVGPAAVDAVFERAPLHGGVVLSASARDERALAVPGERHTMFTGALIDLLRDGDPEGNRDLTIDQAYRYLSRVLPERGAPRPHLRSSDHAADLVLAPNHAYPAEQDIDEPPADVPCPFPGLRSFGPEDTRYFFGRDDVVAEVVSRVTAGAGLIPVVGPSGCGKTSLLRAGAVPALQATGWTVLTMTPGADPVTALDRRAAAFGDRGLLIIDQFEELFTVGAPDADRFIARLADLADDRVTILAGLRADFYGQFLRHPFLADALRERQLIIAPMSSDELRAVITKPAEAAGLRLEEGLAETLLAEAGARPGRDQAAVLPLLSHALLQTWQRRSANRLTLAGYRDTGGIAGAVAQSAEQLFAAMDEADRQVLRDLAPRLVHLSEETEDTRRRLPLAELSDTERRVVDALSHARLVTLDDTRAAFAHDAVLSAWPRLRGWLDENRMALIAAQQLDEAAGEWEDAGRQDAYLFRDLRLARVAATIDGAAGGVRPTPRARRFLDASRVRQRARARRHRSTLAVICVLVLVAGVVAAISVIEGRSNARNTAAKDSSALAADAQAAAAIDPGLAAQLAVAGYRLSPTQDAANEMYTLLNRPMDQSIASFNSPAARVATQPDGTLVSAVDGTNSNVRVWDLTGSSTPELVATIRSGRADLALAPRAPLVATGCAGVARLCLWSVQRPRAPVIVAPLPLPPSVDGNTLEITSMAFSPDDTLLAASTGQGYALLWSVATPDQPRLLGLLPDRSDDPSQAYGAVAFAPDDRMLAQTVTGGSTQLWLLVGPAHPVLAVTLSGGYLDLAFNPAGTLLAAVGGTEAGLWKLTATGRPVAISVDLNVTGDLQSVAFSPDGDTMAFAGTQMVEGSLGFLGALDVSAPGMANIGSASPRMWDLGSGVDWIAYTPDGMLLSGGQDGALRLWHLSDDLLPDSGGANPYTLGLSRTGHLLVSPVELGLTTIDTGIWNIADPRDPVLESILPVEPLEAAFLGSTHGLLVTGDDGTVGLWNVANPRHPVETGTLGSVVRSSELTAISPGGAVTADASGDLVSVLGADGDLRLWRITLELRPTQAGTIVVPDLQQDLAGLLEDGQTAVIITPVGMRWWDTANPSHPVPDGFSALADASTGAATGGGGGLLAAEGQTQADCACANLYLFNVSGRRVRVSPAVTESAGDDMEISDDSKLLATTGDGDNGITLWDIADLVHPTYEATLLTVPDVGGIAISAGDKWLADWDNGTIQLWDIADLAKPALDSTTSFSPQPDNTGLTSQLSQAAFEPSGSTLAVSLDDSTVLVNADPAALAAYFCSETGGTITRQQWSDYVQGIPYADPCPGGGV